MDRLEVHVRRPEGLDHLQGLVERELAQGVAGDAELDLVRGRRIGRVEAPVGGRRAGARRRAGDADRRSGDGRGRRGEEGAARYA